MKEPVAAADLSRFIPAGAALRPTLCISDTHLLPDDGWSADDAPDALLELLRAHPRHRVVVLGDFIESLVLSERAIHGLKSAPRLRRIFRDLSARRSLRVIPGNHDEKARAMLHRLVGSRAIAAGGFSHHRVRFIHGHESAVQITGLGVRLGWWMVPAWVTLGRLRLPRPGVGSNAAVVAAHGRRGEYLVFGHTHRPEVTDTFANSGSFLRGSIRTYLTLKDRRITLWREQ